MYVFTETYGAVYYDSNIQWDLTPSNKFYSMASYWAEFTPEKIQFIQLSSSKNDNIMVMTVAMYGT